MIQAYKTHDLTRRMSKSFFDQVIFNVGFMTACRLHPSLVVLLLLVFIGQTLAASAIYCQRQGHEPQAPVAMDQDAMMSMSMHDHSMHHQPENPEAPAGANTTKADCCSTKGQCHLACSLALASVNLPPAISFSTPVADNYLGLAPAGVFSSVYKPPIAA